MKIIIDGNSIFFKLYFAMIRQDLKNSKGFPTGAVYGFVKFMNSLQTQYGYKREDMFITFDNPTSKDKRREIYPDYKADRSKKADDLYKQLKVVIKLLEAEGFFVLSYIGYEADDICNTLAKAYSTTTGSMVISKDRDLLQVLDHPKTSVLLDKGKGEYQGVNVHTFKELFPFDYQYFSSYKVILGDKSDNVPGVPGVGKKGLETLFQFLEKNKISFDDAIGRKIVIEEPKIEKIIAKIEKNIDIYDRNRSILGLLDVENFHLGQMKAEINQEMLDYIYGELEIKTRIQ